MAFNLSSWAFSHLSLCLEWGFSIPHFPKWKERFCLSFFLPPLQTVHRQYNKTQAGTGDPGALSMAVEGWGQSVSTVSLSVFISQLVCLHCQPPQEQWLAEKDGLFHGKDSPCPSNSPAGLVSSPPQLSCSWMGRWDGPWLPDPALMDPLWVPPTAPSSHS